MKGKVIENLVASATRDASLEELQTSKKLLERALELLDHGKKWTKHMLGNRDTSMCSLGALDEARNEFPSTIVPWSKEYQVAIDFLLDCIEETNYEETYYGDRNIIGFNDHRQTKWHDVEKMFECAIRKADKAIKS